MRRPRPLPILALFTALAAIAVIAPRAAQSDTVPGAATRGSAGASHAAVLSDAQAAQLQQVQTYLNGLRTLRARFLQTAADGRTATGTAWLERPGRMRFEYDKPSPLLLVAGHGLVVFHDASLDQTTNIPIGQTPLGILLRDRFALSGDVTVTAFEPDPDQWQLTLARTATPGDGSLTLLLSPAPMALVGWSVVDAQGNETRIRLSEVTQGGDFDQGLFTFIDPHFFNQNANNGG